MKAYGYDWHQTQVGRIEAGQRPLRLNEAVDLAALFGVSLDTLATRAAPDADIDELRRLAEETSARVARIKRDRTAADARLTAAERQVRIVTEECRRTDALLAGATEELAMLRSRLAQAEGSRGRQG